MALSHTFQITHGLKLWAGGIRTAEIYIPNPPINGGGIKQMQLRKSGPYATGSELAAQLENIVINHL